MGLCITSNASFYQSLDNSNQWQVISSQLEAVPELSPPALLANYKVTWAVECCGLRFNLFLRFPSKISANKPMIQEFRVLHRHSHLVKAMITTPLPISGVRTATLTIYHNKLQNIKIIHCV